MLFWNEATLLSELAGLALKSSAVFAVGSLAALLLRRQSAAARHMVWAGTAAAVLALPLLSLALPGLRVSRSVLPDIVFTATATATPQSMQPSGHAQANSLPPSVSARWRPDWRFWLMFLWAAGTASSLAKISAAYAA